MDLKRTTKTMRAVKYTLALCSLAILSGAFLTPSPVLASQHPGEIGDELEAEGAYISSTTVLSITDGTAPFDTDNSAGNDADAHNLVVRSFDKVSYDVEYVVTPHPDAEYDYYRQARIGFKVVLPYATEQSASFDLDSMGWVSTASGYEPTVTTETIGGVQCQVLTCYRDLIGTSSNPTVVPGTATASFFIDVNALPNAAQFTPTFYVWVDGGEHENQAMYGNALGYQTVPSAVTVSATPRYNIQVSNAATNSPVGVGNWDFSTGNELANNKDKGTVEGRLYAFGINISLYNTSADKKLKGIELPDGNPITFDVVLSDTLTYTAPEASSTTTVDVTNSYTPLVWSVDEQEDTSVKQDGRNVQQNGNVRLIVGASAPYNKITNAHDWSESAYNGGTWSGVQDGNVVHFTVSDYAIDITSFPYRAAGDGVSSTRYYDQAAGVQNIGVFSGGTLWLIQPFENINTHEHVFNEFGTDGTANFTVTATDVKMRAASVSGTNLSEVQDNSNQTNTSDDVTSMSQAVLQPGNMNTLCQFTYADNTRARKEGTDGLNWQHKYSDGTDYSVLAAPLRIVFGNSLKAGETTGLRTITYNFVRFDDKVYYDPSRDWGYAVWAVKSKSHYYYVAKTDKTGWIDDNEQKRTSMTSPNLLFFDDYSELRAGGYKCVGVMVASCYTGDNDDLERDDIRYTVPIKVSDNSNNIDAVSMCNVEACIFTRRDVAATVSEALSIPASDLTRDDYQRWLDTYEPVKSDHTINFDITPSLMKNNGAKYIKVSYNPDGTVTGHYGRWEYGDSLHILGEESRIVKAVAQGGATPKKVFDMDYQQRYVDYALTMSVLDEHGEASGGYTTITVEDTLPPSLSYVSESAFYGGTYTENTPNPGTVTGGTEITPDVTINPDGSTTLRFVLVDVWPEDLEQIHYTAYIGDPANQVGDVVNNQQITNTATISTSYDRRPHTAEDGNLYSTTIQISKLRQQNLTITSHPLFNEQNAPLTFESSLGNYGNNPLVDAIGLDLFPYNGDDIGSDYHGDYVLSSMTFDTASVADLSLLTLWFTNDTAYRTQDPHDLTLAQIMSDPSWVQATINPATGAVTIPTGFEHPVAWAVRDTLLAPNEAIRAEMVLSPTGNEARDVYGMSLTDSDNIVTTLLYVVDRELSGVAWEDLNFDGVRQSTDRLLSGVNVKLVNANGDVVSNLDGIPCMTTTDADGAYTFTKLPAGDFAVVFETTPGSWDRYVPTEKNAPQADKTVDSDADGVYGTNDLLASLRIEPIAMPAVADMAANRYLLRYMDAGIKEAGSTVTLGKYDAADHVLPLPNATFTLQGTSENGTSITASATSNGNGEISFGYIPYGTYTITETTPPEGYYPAVPWTLVHSAQATAITQADNLVDGLKLLNIKAHTVHYMWKGKNDEQYAEKTEAATVVAHNATITVKDWESTGVAVSTGYTPKGWSPNDSGEVTDPDYTSTLAPDTGTITVTDDIWLYGTEEATPYTVHYMWKKGAPNSTWQEVETVSVLYGNTHTVKTFADVYGDIGDDYRTAGYTSYGYGQTQDNAAPSDANIKAPDIAASSNFTMPASDVYLWATEEPTIYHVYYYWRPLDGTYPAQSNPDHTDAVAYGSDYSVKTREGLNIALSTGCFEKTWDKENAYTPTPGYAPLQMAVPGETSGTFTITGDVYLYGTEELNTYTVHYMWHGINDQPGQWRETEVVNNVAHGSTHTVLDLTNANITPTTGCSPVAYGQSNALVDVPDNLNTVAPNTGITITGNVWLWASENWIVYNPAITIEKTASPTSYDPAAAGQQITWNFTITNTGDCPLDNITITDAYLSERGISISNLSATTLAPSASATASAISTVSQEEVNAGRIENTATATGKVSGTSTPQDGQSVTSDPSTATVDLARSADLTVTKTANKHSVFVGNIITYTITVTNTGNVTLSPVTITDNKLGIANEQISTSLAPGASASTQKTYTATASDMETGSIVNVVSAHGTPPTGVIAPEDPTDTATVYVYGEGPGYDRNKIYGPTEIDGYLQNENGKLAFWTSEDKSTADVVISYKQEVEDLLYLATLCTGHGLNNTKLSAELTGAASVADVNVKFEGESYFGGQYSNGADQAMTDTLYPPGEANSIQALIRRSNQRSETMIPKGTTFDLNTAGLLNTNSQSNTYNQYVKINDFTEFENGWAVSTGANVKRLPDVSKDFSEPFILNSEGEHACVWAFARDIVSALESDNPPSCVILSFDPYAWAIATANFESEDLAEDEALMRRAAELLKPYYEQNKVMWLVDDGLLSNNRIKTPAQLGYGDTINSQHDLRSYINFVYPSSVEDFNSENLASTFFAADNQDPDSFYGLFGDNYQTGTSYGSYAGVVEKANQNSVSSNDIVQRSLIAYSLKTKERTAYYAATPLLYRAVVDSEEDIPASSYSVLDLWPDKKIIKSAYIINNPLYADAFTMSHRVAFYQYAILDPISYLENTNEAGEPTNIPDINTWNLNTPTYGYSDAAGATQFIRDYLQDYNKYVITDTLDDNLEYDSATVSYYDVSTHAWVELTNDVSIAHSGQQITATITNPEAIGKQIRLLIHTKSPTFFHTDGANNTRDYRDTNIGKARVQTYLGDEPKLAQNFDSPSLKKDPNINLVKTASPTSIASPTSTSAIEWNFTITNTSDIPLTNISLSDPVVTAHGGTVQFVDNAGVPLVNQTVNLAVGESVKAKATTTQITQEDIDAGKIDNTATVTGKFGTATDAIVTDTDDATVTLATTANLAISKSVAIKNNPSKLIANIGDVLVYTITVTNTGTTTLSGVNVKDTKLGIDVTKDGTLAPGTTWTVPNLPEYTTTLTDAQAGSVINTASAIATSPANQQVGPVQDNAEMPVAGRPSIAITKSVTPSTTIQNAVAGTTQVTWNMTVTNTGDVPLSNISINDPMLADRGVTVTPQETSLAPGLSTTATATCTLTQDDINTGKIKNIVTATGTNPINNTPVTSDPAEAEVPIAQNASLAIDKDVAPATVSNAVANTTTVTWSFTITNTGNVRVENLTVEDAVLTARNIAVTPVLTALDPGVSTTATATMTLTQNDINAGKVVNTAKAKGKDTINGTDVISPEDDATVNITRTPGLDIEKTADKNSANIGDSIVYTIKVTNTGNVTLAPVTISDPMLNVTAQQISASLAPGASATTTLTYTSVAEVDAVAGSVVNTASAHGTPPLSVDPPQDPTDTATTPVASHPSISIAKSANPTRLDPAKEGDTITWSFEITNTGDVTLSNIAVADQYLSSLGKTVSLSKTTLSPGEKVTATVESTTSQAEVDAGAITNIATASGTEPVNQATVTSAPDDADVELVRHAALSIEKTVDKENANIGDTLNYTITITNTGAVTLTNVTYDDPLLHKTGIAAPETTLAPNASTTIHLSYGPLTEADAIAGRIVNTTTAHATPPAGVDDPESPSDSATSTVSANPAISIEKSVEPARIENAKVGDEVEWSFTVTNTGDVTLSSISVADEMLASRNIAITGLPNTLDPNGSTTVKVRMPLTQQDIDSGHVDNTSIASGIDPVSSTETFSDPDDAQVVIQRNPALSIEKTADKQNANIGDTITYTITVKNTGNVTLAPVTVSDPLCGVDSFTIAETLAPGQSASTTCSYSPVTEQDAIAENVVNTASAHGVPPTGIDPPQDPTDTATTEISSHPAISIVKIADPTRIDPAKAGDAVTWSFEVENTGDITLSSITVEDPYLTEIGKTVSLAKTELAPGEKTTGTVTTNTSQAEVDAGVITNIAVAHGTEPVKQTTVSSDPSTATVELIRHADLDIEKTVDKATANIGDTLNYTIKITNTGTVTLTDVKLNDPLIGKNNIVVAETLTPGASTTVNGTYGPVNAEDAANKTILNVAVAHATPPASVTPPQDPTDTATTEIITHPSLKLVKTAEPTAIENAHSGDTVTWSFEITNTGDIALDGISIADAYLADKGTGVTLDKTTLAPGEKARGTAMTTLVQDEVNSGYVLNEATAYGYDVTNGAEVTDADEAEVALGRNAALSLEKTVDKGTAHIGDTLTYTIKITNTGTVTLAPVTYTDPMFGISSERAADKLDPGQSVTITKTYSPVTEADAIANSVTNPASAHGTPPAGVDDPRDPSDTATTEILSSPSLSIDKSASPTRIENAKEGDEITWSFEITNTGDLTLSNIAVEDEFLASRNIAIALDKTTLAPGEKAHASAVMALTQADINAGRVENTAIATGTEPKDNSKVTSPPDTESVELPLSPELSIEKTVDKQTAEIGDTLSYTITITNTGNTTLTNVTWSDPMLSITGETVADVLEPGESIEKTGTWTVIETDAVAGTVVNAASTTGTPPNGLPPITVEDSAETEVGANPSIELIKTANKQNIDPASVGDKITWTFTVKNTGDVSISGVTIDDPMLEVAGVEIDIDPDLVLAPGEKTEFSAEYAITQEDIDTGIVENVAIAHGISATDDKVESEPSEAVVKLAQDPVIACEKNAPVSVIDNAQAGDEITFAMKVTNTGNATLENIVVHDDLPGLTGLAIDWSTKRSDVIVSEGEILVPGEHVTAYATYKITEADIAAGFVANTAYATASVGDEIIESNHSDVSVILIAPTPSDDGLASDLISTGDPLSMTPVAAGILAAGIAAGTLAIRSRKRK